MARSTPSRTFSFHVNEGEIVTLIGANGAGKTTTMHAISGLLKLQSGEINYCGQTSARWRRIRSSAWAWRRCRRAAACSAA